MHVYSYIFSNFPMTTFASRFPYHPLLIRFFRNKIFNTYFSNARETDRARPVNYSHDRNSRTSALHRCSMRTAVSRWRTARVGRCICRVGGEGVTHGNFRVCTSVHVHVCLCVRVCTLHSDAAPRRDSRRAYRLILDWPATGGRGPFQSFTPCTSLPMQPPTRTTRRQSSSVRMQRGQADPFAQGVTARVWSDAICKARN